MTVDVAEGVDCEVKGRSITVKGEKGELARKFMEDFIHLLFK